ncbi:MAG: hypothetical protein ACOC7M_00530 [Chloroflexota bacterium]
MSRTTVTSHESHTGLGDIMHMLAIATMDSFTQSLKLVLRLRKVN